MIELELYKNENDPMNMNYLKSPVDLFLRSTKITFSNRRVAF